ncbi:MAG: hypothetical protein ACUVXA_08460 [Candidatus Jordarchaeum sp.]|uniref:hypothetical protein n=1 Tax=Candidatus Jordarchaeum sp. TaxID=2823881 RepID=UPI00404B44DA
MVFEDSSTNPIGESLENLILETMHSVLKQILGEGSAKIIALCANRYYSLGDKSRNRIDFLDDALRKIISFSASTIENLILKRLYSKLELRFEEKEGYDFLDYINELRGIQFERKNF